MDPSRREGEEPVVEALLDVTRQLDLEPQLRRIRAWLHDTSGAGLSFVFAPGDEERLVLLEASIPGDDPRYRQVRPIDLSWLGADLDAGKPVREAGFGGLQPLGPEWGGFEAAESWIVPLSGDDALAGLVWLIHSETPDDAIESSILAFVRELRPALANALTVRSMRDLVIKDDLARCFNRRYFEEFFPEELERAARFRSPVSLIFFDMDNLKSINNAHGHNMGSQSLYEISVRVRDRIRKFDKLFRFGGDEFCIVLPETDWRGAVEVAERVRASLEAEPFLVGKIDDPAGIPITASFGISSFPLHARSKDALVAEADRAMQSIKGTEKNAVGVARPPKERSG